MIPSVHMVMGVEEANVIGLALNLLDAKIEFDLERWEDENEKDRQEFLSMLSLKFTTESMKESIAELLNDEGDEDYGDDD